jgi:hypothetical protein
MAPPTTRQRYILPVSDDHEATERAIYERIREGHDTNTHLSDTALRHALTTHALRTNHPGNKEINDALNAAVDMQVEIDAQRMVQKLGDVISHQRVWNLIVLGIKWGGGAHLLEGNRG